MIVSKPPLNVELAFYQVLPTLALLYLPLFDTHCRIDVLRLGGLEDAAAVTDEHSWTAMLLNGGVEHYQVGSEVLALENIARKDRATKILQNTDDIEWTLDARDVMLLD